MNYCYGCKFSECCELFNNIDFCEDCVHFEECPIKTVWCDAGHAIECNNGFEYKEWVWMTHDYDYISKDKDV